jgi:hypothetical protein
METATLVALVGVGGSLFGSAVGGLTSYFASRSVRRMDWELTLVEKDIDKREALYADFLTEANRVMMHSAVGESLPALELKALVTLESRIWFYSEPVAEIAREIAKFLFGVDSSDGTKDKDSRYPALRDKYLAACKKDLTAMRKNV